MYYFSFIYKKIKIPSNNYSILKIKSYIQVLKYITVFFIDALTLYAYSKILLKDKTYYN